LVNVLKLLRQPQGLLMAVVLREIFEPPVSKRR
jgi:hypothetical protein